MSGVKTNLQLLCAEVEKLKERNDSLETDVLKCQEEIVALKKKNLDLARELNVKGREIKELKERVRCGREEIGTRTSKTSIGNVSRREFDTVVTRLQGAEKQVENILKVFNRALVSSQNKEDLIEQVESLERDVRKLDAVITRLGRQRHRGLEPVDRWDVVVNDEYLGASRRKQQHNLIQHNDTQAQQQQELQQREILLPFPLDQQDLQQDRRPTSHDYFYNNQQISWENFIDNNYFIERIKKPNETLINTQEWQQQEQHKEQQEQEVDGASGQNQHKIKKYRITSQMFSLDTTSVSSSTQANLTTSTSSKATGAFYYPPPISPTNTTSVPSSTQADLTESTSAIKKYRITSQMFSRDTTPVLSSTQADLTTSTSAKASKAAYYPPPISPTNTTSVSSSMKKKPATSTPAKSAKLDLSKSIANPKNEGKFSVGFKSEKSAPRIQWSYIWKVNPTKMKAYDDCLERSIKMDMRSGNYTVAKGGWYNFNLYCRQTGKGSLEWTICRDCGTKVGKTLNTSDTNKTTSGVANWYFAYEGRKTNVWVEVERKSGNAEVGNCRFSGFRENS